MSDYTKQIDALIPYASDYATVMVAVDDYSDKEDFFDAWNVVYHAEMMRLAHEAGIRRSRYHSHLEYGNA